MNVYTSKNGIYFIGKLKDLKLQLSNIKDKHLTVAEYIKKHQQLHKQSLN